MHPSRSKPYPRYHQCQQLTKLLTHVALWTPSRSKPGASQKCTIAKRGSKPGGNLVPRDHSRRCSTATTDTLIREPEAPPAEVLHSSGRPHPVNSMQEGQRPCRSIVFRNTEQTSIVPRSRKGKPLVKRIEQGSKPLKMLIFQIADVAEGNPIKTSRRGTNLCADVLNGPLRKARKRRSPRSHKLTEEPLT